MQQKSKIRALLRYIISVHILSLIILTIIRFILLITNISNVQDISIGVIFSALIRGVWFDNVIACFISIVPLVLLSVCGLTNYINKTIIRICNIYYILLFGTTLALSFADIPYFNYFFKHLNASIFNWKEEGGNALSMILEESSYYIYFGLFLVIIIGFIFLLVKSGRRVIRTGQSKIKPKQYFYYIPLCFILISLTLLGIRGRIGRNPIKTSQAYFCNNSFLNQLGLNPTFFLIRSIIENSKKHISANNLLSTEAALSYTQKELNIPIGQELPSPLFRRVSGDSNARDINVVFILMESMSANLLEEKNGSLTPYLNELKNESYYFSNFYSAGNHTNHGVAASLFGLPSLFDKNMMKNVEIPKCDGITNELEKKGYSTLFFVTHESQYDNMNAFLLENGIQKMYAQEDYPRSKVVNGFGVQDDYLFEFAFDKLNAQAKENKPFFATILTISNHPPYVVPEKYKNRSDKPEEQIVAFADDAIKQFMDKVKLEEWYNNTIFVILGDHGKIVGKPIYDMPLAYNHIPLIIHSPLLLDSPKTITNLGGQVDVFPTVMGLLNYSYTNNTLGLDILKQKRPYMYFTSDDMMGCINDKYYYIYNPVNKTKSLFDYRAKNTTNVIEAHTSLADSMQKYAASMLISTDFLLKNKLTRVN